jgi:Sulfotransferase family
LQQIYGDHLWLNYEGDFSLSAVPRGIKCIHGHIPGKAYDGIFPQLQSITMVRDPVQRVVSNYYHFLHRPDDRNFASLRLHSRRLSLREFAELEDMRNEASRYVAGRAPEDFAFVGLTERFAESLLIYRRIFRIAQPLMVFHENVNRERNTPTYRLSPGDYDHLLALNALDLEWYERASRVFEKALARQTADARPRPQIVGGLPVST